MCSIVEDELDTFIHIQNNAPPRRGSTLVWHGIFTILNNASLFYLGSHVLAQELRNSK